MDMFSKRIIDIICFEFTRFREQVDILAIIIYNYILNRSPAYSVQNMTPHKTSSEDNTTISYFKFSDVLLMPSFHMQQKRNWVTGKNAFF